MNKTFYISAAIIALIGISATVASAETVRQCLDRSTKYEERLDCYAVQDRNTERTYRPKKEDDDKSEPSKPDHSTPGDKDPTKPGDHGPGKDSETGDEGGGNDDR